MNHSDYLERVRDLLPGIRERAAACEQLRRLPDETFKEFQQSGLLRALQPGRWGGHELSPLTLYEAAIEVAAACPSTAWFLSVIAIHNWQLGLFPERAQADVWAEDSSVQISSSYAARALLPGAARNEALGSHPHRAGTRSDPRHHVPAYRATSKTDPVTT